MTIDDKLAFARFQSAIDNDDDYTFDSICRRYVNETKKNKELIKFVINHLKTFKAYPLEFEYKNKVYNYKTIIKIINNRKQQASEQKG